MSSMIATIKTWDERFDLRIQGGDETEAQSFSGPAVLVFEASQHSVPHVLQQHTSSNMSMIVLVSEQ